MVSKESVEAQLKKLGFNLNSWGRAEIRELPHILIPGEEIYELVNGTYEGGFALVVATDVRLLLVDKKPMNYLTVEDIRFDMISEIDYSHRLLGASILISTGLKDLRFRSYNQPRLRKLISHVQHSIAQTKKQQSQSQLGQNHHLEKINQQLQRYLKAQNDYQLQALSERRGLSNNTQPLPRPSNELSDYLFARSLLAQYQAQTGKELRSEFAKDITPIPATVISQTASPSYDDLNDLWAAGVSEVFGRRSQPNRQAQDSLNTSKTDGQHNSFEINPVSVVFSKLPTLIRNRKFSKLVAQLSSDTAAG